MSTKRTVVNIGPFEAVGGVEPLDLAHDSSLLVHELYKLGFTLHVKTVCHSFTISQVAQLDRAPCGSTAVGRDCAFQGMSYESFRTHV